MRTEYGTTAYRLSSRPALGRFRSISVGEFRLSVQSVVRSSNNYDVSIILQHLRQTPSHFRFEITAFLHMARMG